MWIVRGLGLSQASGGPKDQWKKANERHPGAGSALVTGFPLLTGLSCPVARSLSVKLALVEAEQVAAQPPEKAQNSNHSVSRPSWYSYV